MKYTDTQLHDVAKIHARAWKSDPFAYKRILQLMRNGYEDAKEVAADALRMLNERGEKWAL